MGVMGRKVSLQGRRYRDRESLPASKPIVILPRTSDRDLERIRERARDYVSRGYSIGVIEMLLGVSEQVVRSLVGAIR